MTVAQQQLGETNVRAQAFGYECRRCTTCCFGKDIQVNPYEIARLARRLGETTAEFRAIRTHDGRGTVLNRSQDDDCIFLGRDGCAVHADRPLVCRLYPLGRHVLDDGTEWFSRMELDDGSAGEITDRGTIAGYIEAQGAGPFLKAADEYFAWLCAARARIAHSPDATLPDASATESCPIEDLTDMDSAISRHCAANDAVEPTDIEERRKLHLTILHRQLDDF